MKWPTWEISKEVADKLPPKDESKDEKCPECGYDLKKDKKGS